jgi:tetratricopeptide (TPR) repeat protein
MVHRFMTFGMAVWLLLAFGVRAQEKGVAFFSKVKGSVKVVDAKGKETKATTSTKLNDGDRVVAGKDGSATITYYSGKEVMLAAGKSYAVKGKQEESSFLSSLYSTLSNLVWGETSGSSMAGATRAWAGDANRMITATYPSETKILESEPVFKWVDHRKNAGKDYLVTIRSEITSFKYEIPVSGSTEITYPKTAPKLSEDDKYVWTVKDPKGADVSPEVHFSLIHPDDKTTMEDDLKEVIKVCNGDNTNPQFYLLSAALYRDYGLMKQAENAILNLIALKPDMAQAHIMLATLYKETGRLEEAKVAEDTARKLAEGGK